MVESRVDVVRADVLQLFLDEGFAGLGVGDIAARLRCSRSTLYAIAPSKEQLIATTVRAFFRDATERVEGRLEREVDPVKRIEVYLGTIAGVLSAGSPAFFADVESFAPAREIYGSNTTYAASRVTELVRAAGGRRGDADFVGLVAARTMEAIHRGDVRQQTGRDDAAAYRALARLVVAAVSR